MMGNQADALTPGAFKSGSVSGVIDDRKDTDNGANASVHSVGNHENSSKYQKSFPTPKNTTPLGYHTRKK